MAVHPSFQERRITVRLLSYWEKLRRGRPMPAEQDIDPDHIQDLWDHCFMIHTKELGREDYHYTYLGSEIKKAYQGGLAEIAIDGVVSPNAQKLKNCFATVIETRKPLIDEGEFRNLHGDVVKYRQCLLPLGEEGKVQAIFGGLRCKVYTSK